MMYAMRMDGRDVVEWGDGRDRDSECNTHEWYGRPSCSAGWWLTRYLQLRPMPIAVAKKLSSGHCGERGDSGHYVFEHTETG